MVNGMCEITNLVEQQEQETGKLYQFPNKKAKQPEIDPLEKECTKVKLDGTPKKTKNNAKRNRDNVQPFKEEDVPKLIKYLRDKIATSKNHEDELINRRNLAIFVMGINIGLRVSDLCKLRWNEVFDTNWNFLEGKIITPKKQENSNKKVLLAYNQAFRQSLLEFKEYYGEVRNINGYIFKSREGGHISPDAISVFIKNASKAIGIKYNVNTHSMRKTFARVRYDHAEDKEQMLIKLGEIFQHSKLSTTRVYLCISQEEIIETYNEINLGLDM
jgi:integrase